MLNREIMVLDNKSRFHFKEIQELISGADELIITHAPSLLINFQGCLSYITLCYKQK